MKPGKIRQICFVQKIILTKMLTILIKKKNVLKIEIKKVMLSNLLNDKKFSLQIKADGHSPVTKRNIF